MDVSIVGLWTWRFDVDGKGWVSGGEDIRYIPLPIIFTYECLHAWVTAYCYLPR